MRKHRVFLLSVVLMVLMIMVFGSVSAAPSENFDDVIEKYQSMEKLFLEELTKSEWVYVITDFEFNDESNLSLITRENWFHYNEGKSMSLLNGQLLTTKLTRIKLVC